MNYSESYSKFVSREPIMGRGKNLKDVCDDQTNNITSPTNKS
jgi:hypothetical protein